MRIEEYLKTLPGETLSGENIRMPRRMLEDVFRFADLKGGDILYHLGCKDATGVQMAAEEFGISKAVGVDLDPDYGDGPADGKSWRLARGDMLEWDMCDATVILFWFTEEAIVERMTERFGALRPGTRVVTVWGPLPGCLPSRVRFPYVMNEVPFRRAGNVAEQVRAVFGVDCVDFVTAWEHAERYTKAVGSPDIKNDRFLTIIQTLVIWANAKSMGVACGDAVPEPIRTYATLMKNSFGIDFDHLLG